MDKTLHLLEMGFSNHEISIAIEKIGKQLRLFTCSSNVWNVYERNIGMIACHYIDMKSGLYC